MELQSYIFGIVCIIIALIVMFRLMHYAHFYASSYFFWIGVIITIAGVVSLIHPLSFLFIMNRIMAVWIIIGGTGISLISVFSPIKLRNSRTNNQKIDTLLPIFSFSEFHEVRINASPEKVKYVLQVTGVKDIPVAKLLMKIRGIADKDVDLSDRVSNNLVSADTISTPDFNFFVDSPEEWVTVMILKSVIITKNESQPAPPKISTLDEFIVFNNPGYVKVVVNFRFTCLNEEETLLNTETRVQGVKKRDSQIFGIYWRIIYPGSAIIRRVWLDTIKRKAQTH